MPPKRPLDFSPCAVAPLGGRTGRRGPRTCCLGAEGMLVEQAPGFVVQLVADDAEPVRGLRRSPLDQAGHGPPKIRHLRFGGPHSISRPASADPGPWRVSGCHGGGEGLRGRRRLDEHQDHRLAQGGRDQRGDGERRSRSTPRGPGTATISPDATTVTQDSQGVSGLYAPNLTQFGFPSNFVQVSGLLLASYDLASGAIISMPTPPHVELDVCVPQSGALPCL
jgi:hypothetical protein